MGAGSGCVVWVFFHGTNVPIPPKLVSLPQAKWRCCSLVWTRHSYTWMMSLGNQERKYFSTALQTYTTNNHGTLETAPLGESILKLLTLLLWYGVVPEFTSVLKSIQELDFTHWSYACSWGKTDCLPKTVSFLLLSTATRWPARGTLAKKQDHLLASWVILFSFLCVVMDGFFLWGTEPLSFFTVPIIHWVFQLLVLAILRIQKSSCWEKLDSPMLLRLLW